MRATLLSSLLVLAGAGAAVTGPAWPGADVVCVGVDGIICLESSPIVWTVLNALDALDPLLGAPTSLPQAVHDLVCPAPVGC